MINPGGSPGTSFSRSAMTRFNNNQIRAQQASMVGNPAAQASLRKQTSKSTPAGQPVGNAVLPQPQAPISVPTGGPQLPVEQTAEFDPAVFQESLLDQVVNEVRTQGFVNSPRVKDAVTTVTLKNFFNATNPQAMPDTRSLFKKILSRLNMEGS